MTQNTPTPRLPLPYPVVEHIPEYIRTQMPRLYSPTDWVIRKSRVQTQLTDIRLKQKILKLEVFQAPPTSTDLELAALQQEFEENKRVEQRKLIKAEQSKLLQLAMFDEWRHLHYPEGIPRHAYREKAQEELTEELEMIADNRFIRRLRAKLRYTAECTARVIEVLLNPTPDLSEEEIQTLQEMHRALIEIDERYSD
jgi:hypothetical protein